MTKRPAPPSGGGFDISRAWTDERARGVIFQILIVLGVAGLAVLVVRREDLMPIGTVTH